MAQGRFFRVAASKPALSAMPMQRFARPMKLLAKLIAGRIALLVLAVAVVWMMVPLNVPWKRLVQQMTLLPVWLDSRPISVEQVESQLVVAEGYGVSLFATGIADARILRVTAAGDVLVSTLGPAARGAEVLALGPIVGVMITRTGRTRATGAL